MSANLEPDNVNVIAAPERKLCNVSPSSIRAPLKYSFIRASADELVNGLFTIWLCGLVVRNR